MEIGTALAVVGSVFGIGVPTAAVWITVLKVKGKPSLEVCPLHSGIVATLEYVKDSIDEVKGDIKELLKKGD